MRDTRMPVRKLAAEAATDWAQVGDQQIFVNDLVDASTDPDARMTVGFARSAKGETFDVAFPYDEVVVVTKGTYTVRTEQGETVTAHAGDAIYLPAGSSNVHQFEEDVEVVYVANPPDVYAAHVAASAE